MLFERMGKWWGTVIEFCLYCARNFSGSLLIYWLFFMLQDLTIAQELSDSEDEDKMMMITFAEDGDSN